MPATVPETQVTTDAAGREQGADRQRVARERFTENRAGSGGGATGRIAVPRQGPPPRTDRDGDWNRGSDRDWHRYGYRSYSPRARNYYNYYNYYPRPYYYYPYSFGYGPRGRGFFYFDLHYDSYVFYPRTIIRYDNYGNYYGNYGYPTGELRIQVQPRDAQVFVDGFVRRHGRRLRRNVPVPTSGRRGVPGGARAARLSSRSASTCGSFRVKRSPTKAT